MLWPSMWRWNCQRSSIGKLAASVWCFRIDCRPTTIGLAIRIAASSSSEPRRSLHSCWGCTSASQSTTLPSIENRIASKAPVIAVHSVISAIQPRVPSLAAQRKAKKRRGGAFGSAAG